MYVLSFPDGLRRDSVAFDDVLSTAALEILRRAHRYAVRAGMDVWDFSVEIDEFHRAQISNSDLRWLLSQNLARHADETTPTNGKRRFRRAPLTSLNERSCFIIAEAGLELLESLDSTIELTAVAAQRHIAHAAMQPNGLNGAAKHCSKDHEKPFWDALRRELRVGERVVKHFRRPAASQHKILDAFQAALWPSHVIDPLPLKAAHCPKRRLHDAIKRLNRGHRQAAIRFYGDGSGRGVLWEIIG